MMIFTQTSFVPRLFENGFATGKKGNFPRRFLPALRPCLMIVLAGMFALSHPAEAQYLPAGCPGTWINYGGGMACQCPDGNLANMVGGSIVCNSAPAVPDDRVYCPNGGICPNGTTCCGQQCCNPGNYCSHYGCTPQGAVECGGYYCNPGMACATGGCMPAGNTDCHNGHNCSPGQKCSRGGGCIPDDKADCGQGRYCEPGMKCSRDAKRCMAEDAVDCGSYTCNAGMKCGSGNRCIVSTDIDCGSGRSCPSGTVCIRGGAECLTRAEIAQRAEAEKRRRQEEFERKKREAEERRQEAERKKQEAIEARKRAEEEQRRADAERRQEAERKKQEAIEAKKKAEEDKRRAIEEEKKRQEAAAAQRAAELEAQRKGINSAKAPGGSQGPARWNNIRMRRAPLLPAPRLERGVVPIIPRSTPLGPPDFADANNVDGGQGIPANLAMPPLKWAGRLFFTKPDSDAACSGQFISPRVVLTAAHCVRDADSGKYYSNFAFALQYHDGAYSHRYGWKCVATLDGWVSPPKDRFRSDYAMILTDDVSLTGYFGWQSNWAGGDTTAYKIGYPVGIANGEIVQVDKGPLAALEGLLQLKHDNPDSNQGSSGGAWVVNFQTTAAAEANRIVSVTSFYRTGDRGIAYGPALGADFKRLLDYVSRGCQ